MKRSSLSVMLQLLKLVKPLKGTIILAITMGVLGHLCAIMIPVLGGFVLMGESSRLYLTVLPIIAILRGVFHLLEQNRNHYLAFKLLALIRDQVFGILRKLAPAKLEGRDQGDLIALITSDIELLEVFYAHTISPIFIAIIISTLMTIIIGSFHPILGMIALIAYIAVGVVIPIIVGKISRKYGQAFRSEFGALDAYVLDHLRGIKESIQYGTGDLTLEKINEYSASLAGKEKRMKYTEGNSIAMTSGIILIFDMIMLFCGAVLLKKGMIDGRALVLSVITLMSSFGPVIALANLGVGIQNTLAAGSRVLDLLEESPIIEEVDHQCNIEYSGAKCENISFSYNQEMILKDFSIDLPQQGIIGITGKSGSGKSTLLKLLMRFWDADSGSIQIANIPIQHINTASLRENESFMRQETILFHDSIERNLLIANPLAEHEQIVEACKKAAIHEFIISLPEGYNTTVGELGDNLSGGQKQRLGLARCFLHGAPLMLLDEPTSNLDSLNEAIILKSLKEYCQDKTVLLVSHRKSTMCIANQIYSVENGRVS